MMSIPDITPLTFAQALAQAEVQARTHLDTALHERLSCAVALVHDGQVLEADDGHSWCVTDTTAPEGHFRVNGTCACPDAAEAPKHLCKHRLGMFLARRVLELRATPPAPVVPPAEADPWPEREPVTPGADHPPTGEETDDLRTIAPKYIQWIHGKAHVKYVGLLAMAHEAGLVSLEAELVRVTATLALAKATAVFQDGRRFSEAADATPENCGTKEIAKHFPRLALTRAKARALKDGLNIGLVSTEEIGV